MQGDRGYAHQSFRGYERDGILSLCTDGLQNGDEDGVDCGGSCKACPRCTDGVKNGDEEGIDCGAACQLMCRWPRSCLEMLRDQPSLASGNYTIYPWKDEDAAGAPKGRITPDTMRPIPDGYGVRVECDMATDGGGYTTFAVAGGTPTSNHTAPNSCDDQGMQLVVPRSKRHWDSLLRLYGARFFELVPGIYKKTSGGDYGTYAMNSANAPEWRAVDGGSWWLSDEPILEPNGDYSANCWLGMSAWNVTTSGLRFNDERFNNTCVVSSSSYVCSTNDKDFNDNAHPQYRPHEPDTPMLIQSAESFVAIAKELQRRQPPYHATLVADVVVDLGALAIPSSKTLHVISHPEATSRFSIQQADGTNSGIFHVKPNGVLQLEDVVLRKGRRQRGGAININSGSVELTNCLVANNTASSQGGGVYSNMGHVNLVNSTFEGNSAQSGGAVYSERGTLRTKNVLFEKNTATTHNGGAVYSQMGSVLLFNATLSKNRAKSGGAVYNDEAKLMLQQSRLELNTASHQGGAVYNRYGAITLESSGVDRNLGFHKGGAVYNHYGTLALNASTFQCNLAKWRAYDYHKLKITKFLGKRANDFNRLDRSGNAVYHRYHSDPAGHLCFACTENSTLLATQQDDVQHGDYYQYARRVMVPAPPPPPAPAPSPEAAANGEAPAPAPAPAPLQAAAPTYVWNATRRSAWCSGAVPHGTAATLAGCKALCTGGCTGIYTKADQTLELADIQLARVTGCEPQHVVRHAASPSRK